MAPLPRPPPASRTRTRPSRVADDAARARRARRRPAGRRAGPGSSTHRRARTARSDGPDEPIGAAGRPGGGSPAARTARTSTKRRDGIAGQPEQERRRSAVRAASATPNANGLPGWTATRQSSIRPISANAARTTSYGPTDTPPETIDRVDAADSPAMSRARTSSSRSAAMPRSWACAAGLLDERRPGPGRSRRGSRPARASAPGPRTSSPVARIPTRGRRWTGSVSLPEPAARAIAAGVRPGARRAGSRPPRAGRRRPAGSRCPAPIAAWTRTAGGQRAGRIAAALAGGRAVGVGRRRQLDLDDGVGPRRDRRAGRDPDRRPALAPRASGAAPARTSPIDLEPDGRVLGRGGDVARPGSRSRPSPSCPTAAAP